MAQPLSDSLDAQVSRVAHAAKRAVAAHRLLNQEVARLRDALAAQGIDLDIDVTALKEAQT